MRAMGKILFIVVSVLIWLVVVMAASNPDKGTFNETGALIGTGICLVVFFWVGRKLFGTRRDSDTIHSNVYAQGMAAQNLQDNPSVDSDNGGDVDIDFD